MKRRILYLLSIMLCAGLLMVMFFHKTNVCEKQAKPGLSQKDNNTLSETLWKNPETISEYVNENLSFDARVIIPQNFTSGVFCDTVGIYQEYDKESFFDYFTDSELVVSKTEYVMKDRRQKKSTGVSYTTKNDEGISLYPQLLVYIKRKLTDQYFQVFSNAKVNYTMYNADKYSMDEDLNFRPYKEAVYALENILAVAGLDCGQYKAVVYALDLETMKAEYQRIYEWGVDGQIEIYDWDAEDEAYQLYIWQQTQGLPVWTGKVENYSFIEESNAPVSALYRKDGFAEVRISDVFRFEYGEKENILLTSEEIAQKIKEKYRDVDLNDSITIQEMELCALACNAGDGTCNIVPVWACMYLADSFANGISSQMIFNAVTGNEIYAN